MVNVVMDEPVTLHPYDPAWPDRFRTEAAALTGLLGPWISGGVHHFGSTSIPGLTAKPVIDIMIGVADLESSRPCIDVVARLDYLYAPYRADEMHWFCKPSPSRRTHHLHLVPTGSPRYVDDLAFRDYLRAHPPVAERYAALKRDLAARFRTDRDAYTAGKTDMVAAVSAKARAWASPEPS